MICWFLDLLELLIDEDEEDMSTEVWLGKRVRPKKRQTLHTARVHRFTHCERE